MKITAIRAAWLAMFGHDLVWVENKRTPIVVSQGAAPSSSSHYHPDSDGKEVKRRKANADEEKTIANGDWVRVNKDDKKPSDEGYMDRKSKVRPQHNKSSILPDTVFGLLDMMTNCAAFGDGYDGVTHAGIALVALDTGRVLMAQRALDESDDEAVRETWEFPGGGLDDGEEPYAGALREFREEIGPDLSDNTLFDGTEVIDGWRAGESEQYQGFVVETPTEWEIPAESLDSDEVQKVRWMTRNEVQETIDNGAMRPELVASMDWDIVFEVSGNQPETLAAAQVGTDPEYLRVDDEGNEVGTATVLDIGVPEELEMAAGPIPIHGVIAPEAMESGDGRGFDAGSMTSRPLRLPFSWQKVSGSGHAGSVVVGSIDRIMRSGGLIHFEGLLMETPDADEFADLLAFFGRYGISVDGDRASGTEDETSGVLWFDAVRAAGATAVHIPAFAEAYVAFGPHPDMPLPESEEATAMVAALDMSGGQQTFDRGPGWITDPVPTKRIHSYWTTPGQPGYAKIAWGTGGDFRRCRVLVGEKIAENSPTKLRFINQICARWHHDALGYWPGELGKPGNAPDTAENRKRAAMHAGLSEDEQHEITDLLTKGLPEDSDFEVVEDEDAVWEAVLVSSAAPRKVPPLNYFHQHASMKADPWKAESGALVIEDPDENGYQRTWGYAAEWGVCHVGMDGRCVEPPRTYSNDYSEFHLGKTRTADGYVSTGVLTYGVGHRDSDTILSESPTQAYFDNINNAWAAVRVGENERGIWFSGVVLPKVDADDIVKIEASGQVSGEWKRDAMRACLTVNVPGFPNQQASATYDEEGNVLAMAASAFGQVKDAPCSQSETDDPIGDLADEIQIRLDAKQRFAALKAAWGGE